ncbi:GL24651 [Drosophila persimilis]|uniref:GL24651 n=1 Tax=Drosophila persimilis TaxID=7234 RepID=B4H5V0_DROPE|nr:GL24651 [Drosophila persimilis]
MRLLCLLLACYISAIVAHRPSYRSGPGGYVDVVDAPGAAASAANLDGADWHAWEQVRPLLAKRYGPLDKLQMGSNLSRRVTMVEPMARRRCRRSTEDPTIPADRNSQ